MNSLNIENLIQELKEVYVLIRSNMNVANKLETIKILTESVIEQLEEASHDNG